jgi:hypothetical protein
VLLGNLSQIFVKKATPKVNVSLVEILETLADSNFAKFDEIYSKLRNPHTAMRPNPRSAIQNKNESFFTGKLSGRKSNRDSISFSSKPFRRSSV